jgi:hypothetical protein
MTLAGLITVGLIACSTVAVGAGTGTPKGPAWIAANGAIDYSKIPDDARIAYKCWNGKDVTLTGKFYKQKGQHALPGSADYALSMAKSRELAAIPGVVRMDAAGGEVMTIDESNPAVEAVMKKYEAKEYPQCQ